jgi:hypothetical protein
MAPLSANPHGERMKDLRNVVALCGLLAACSGAPVRLSETGLYSDVEARTLAPGVMAFEPRFPLWTDGAVKRRWAWLPEGTTIDVRDPDAWVFPVGARLWKEFSVDGVALETRYLEKSSSGWRFEAYVWDVDGREARANAFLGAPNVSGTKHDVPGQGDCVFCHGDREAPLGFTAVQLAAAQPDRPLDLAALSRRGWLSAPLDDAAHVALRDDPEVALALGGLHANCGGCHSDSGVESDELLRLRLRSSDRARGDTGFFTTAIGRDASRTIAGRRTYVVPGDVEKSLVFHRLSSRGDASQMPPLGTEVKNEALEAQVRALIESLAL